MFLKNYKSYLNYTLYKFQRCLHVNKTFRSNNLCVNTFKCETEFDKLIETHIDKFVFNSYLYKTNPKFSFKTRLKFKQIEKNYYDQIQSAEPLPTVLKYITTITKMPQEELSLPSDETKDKFHFPYGSDTAISVHRDENVQENQEDEITDKTEWLIRKRYETYTNLDHSKWMVDYENYEDDETQLDCKSEWRINYGTPDAESEVSYVPCGGCGALLHCKDTAIPGYIPSEIYKNSFKKDGIHLKGIVCQRCHFLKNYNLALQMRVLTEDYPKILETIKNKKGLILLVVDLLDFPCSIWPGIINILGHRKPIIVVGNKVDLLPRDSTSHLQRVASILEETVKESIGKHAAANVKHVSLISAKTGWGIEELITKIHNVTRIKGDIFLVGCTNVGKSSLFNCLLQSDLCKIQAVDLVQRATTSVWPGTTMNLLKFPILRPSGWYLFVRTKRLQSLNKIKAAQERINRNLLKETGESKYATLMGHMDRTFTLEMYQEEEQDPFSIKGHANASGQTKIGVNENNPIFAASKWCYDTPGVVHPEQIIHLLTTEELTLTLPRSLIRPQTFRLKLGQCVFIAGLARLDYITGPDSILITVFCGESLPITICSIEHAQELYDTFLGTVILLVPKGSTERLQQWRNLKRADLQLLLKGVQNNIACGDILLSNAGWISVSSKFDTTFNAWTPEARGIHIRKSILPFAVELRGHKIKRTPAYTSYKYFINK
ncbi:hypothetical protein FQA39_LY02571 [Lamprigera yunnana]|nr:hypothetical protein FQA39_LY02571 [Lamprigera yunnana]